MKIKTLTAIVLSLLLSKETFAEPQVDTISTVKPAQVTNVINDEGGLKTSAVNFDAKDETDIASLAPSFADKSSLSGQYSNLLELAKQAVNDNSPNAQKLLKQVESLSNTITRLNAGKDPRSLVRIMFDKILSMIGFAKPITIKSLAEKAQYDLLDIAGRYAQEKPKDYIELMEKLSPDTWAALTTSQLDVLSRDLDNVNAALHSQAVRLQSMESITQQINLQKAEISQLQDRNQALIALASVQKDFMDSKPPATPKQRQLYAQMAQLGYQAAANGKTLTAEQWQQVAAIIEQYPTEFPDAQNVMNDWKAYQQADDLLNKYFIEKVKSAKTISAMVEAIKAVGPGLDSLLNFDAYYQTGHDEKLQHTIAMGLATEIVTRMLDKGIASQKDIAELMENIQQLDPDAQTTLVKALVDVTDLANEPQYQSGISEQDVAKFGEHLRNTSLVREVVDDANKSLDPTELAGEQKSLDDTITSLVDESKGPADVQQAYNDLVAQLQNARESIDAAIASVQSADTSSRKESLVSDNLYYLEKVAQSMQNYDDILKGKSPLATLQKDADALAQVSGKINMVTDSSTLASLVESASGDAQQDGIEIADSAAKASSNLVLTDDKKALTSEQELDAAVSADKGASEQEVSLAKALDTVMGADIFDALEALSKLKGIGLSDEQAEAKINTAISQLKGLASSVQAQGIDVITHSLESDVSTIDAGVKDELAAAPADSDVHAEIVKLQQNITDTEAFISSKDDEASARLILNTRSPIAVEPIIPDEPSDDPGGE